jgi:type IV pilus assembly protein PilQ
VKKALIRNVVISCGFMLMFLPVCAQEVNDTHAPALESAQPDIEAAPAAAPAQQAVASEQDKAIPDWEDIDEGTAKEMVSPETGDQTSSPDRVTLDFKEADILNVLKILSYKAGINIVTTPDVVGNVTVRLVDVPWETALDVILKTYGYGYQRQGNIILVGKLENISKLQAEEVLQTEIINLKFLDAQDAEKIIIPLMSPRGKISVLYARGQKGWKFGTFKIGKSESSQALEREAESAARTETISIERTPTGDLVSKKADFEPSIKSKTLLLTDTPASLDRIRNIILPQIDKKPKQVIIETRIMEVNRDKLKDIGIDYGTGVNGAEGNTLTTANDIGLSTKNKSTLAGRNVASEFTPSLFGPKEGVTVLPGTEPYKAGLEMIYKKITGTQFQIIMHALEEDAYTNTLSAPRVMTLDNQEASILVGFHTPILSSSVTAGSDSTGPTQTQNLDYYQEIGIRLNVVPQISDEGYINMIIHPSVTSTSASVTATNVAGTGSSAIQTSVDYPIIDVREAQTQVLMKSGETIVLGGLLKDVKSKQIVGVPFLSKLPLLGQLFKRETVDTAKIDLLIFISAHIVGDEQSSVEELAKLQGTFESYDAGKKQGGQ